MNDDDLAPLVDGLTGGLSAIILVSMFLMISSVGSTAAGVQDLAKKSLYELDQLSDSLGRVIPLLDLEKQEIRFSRHFFLNDEQKEAILKSIGNNPINITIEAKEYDDVTAYNGLFFIKSLGLDFDVVESIKFNENRKSLTTIKWR